MLPEAQEIKRLFAKHFMLEHLSESDLDGNVPRDVEKGVAALPALSL